MRPYDSYKADLVFAFVFRVGLYVWILAVLALIAACSPFGNPREIIPPGVISAPQAISPVDGVNGTRSDTPQDGGCHEKSDRTPGRPA